VIVAVVTVRVVQVAFDQVVQMFPVGYRFVTAIRPVDVVLVVGRTAMLRGALGGVGPVDLEGMFVDVVLVGKVQVSVVEIADVVPVTNRGMAAIRPVHVVVPIMLVVTHTSRIRRGRLGVTVGRPL